MRFYFNYGNATIKEVNFPSTNFTQQSVGFQLRAYFNYDLSDYKITPIIRFQFDTALATKFKNITRNYNIVDNYFITAKGFAPVNGAITEGSYGSTGANADANTGGELRGGYIASIPNTYYAEEQLRAYFNYDFSSYNMKLTPIIRLQFDMALATKYNNKYNNIEKTTAIVDNYYITAKGFAPSGGARIGGVNISTGANADVLNGELKGGYIASIPSPSSYYAEEPYRIGLAFPVGFRAMNESKTIELYVEPALSLTIVNAKNIYSYQQVQTGSYERRKSMFYTFGYVVYGELYVRPIPQLEWYTEIQTGGATVAGELANTSGSTSLILNASTGITWYF
ncbi:putative variable surface protein VspH [Brachyspira sp. CAG:700]|nr:putative variable surface protein VspH [Brachyspira sp. CAG:700]